MKWNHSGGEGGARRSLAPQISLHVTEAGALGIPRVYVNFKLLGWRVTIGMYYMLTQE